MMKYSVSSYSFSQRIKKGEINHRAYLEKLRDVGYTGPIGIEAPRLGDRLWFAKCDLAYVKELMEEI